MKKAFASMSLDDLSSFKQATSKDKLDASRSTELKEKRLLLKDEVESSDTLKSRHRTKTDSAKQNMERMSSIITQKQFGDFIKKFYHIQRNMFQDDEKCIRCKLAELGTEVLNNYSLRLGSLEKPNRLVFQVQKLPYSFGETYSLITTVQATSISFALQDLIKKKKILKDPQTMAKHYAIYAPPGSGKTTLQIELLKRGVFVQDFDMLYIKSAEALKEALEFSSVLVNDPSKIGKDMSVIAFVMNETDFIKRVRTKTGQNKEVLKSWFEETKFSHIEDKVLINMSNTHLLDWIKMPEEHIQISLKHKDKLNEIVEQVKAYNVVDRTKRKRVNVLIQNCCLKSEEWSNLHVKYGTLQLTDHN